VCDNGRQFTGSAFQETVASMKTQLIYVGTYAHWAAGKIERWHRVLNERVRAGIFEYQNGQSAKQTARSRQYLGKVSITVSPELVEGIVQKVVDRWNACPRARTGISPHDTLRRYQAWIYPEIRRYQPEKNNIGEQTDQGETSRRTQGDLPEVGEIWTVRIRPTEHPTTADKDLPSKLRPLYRYCEIKAKRQGRYIVQIDGMQQVTRKELEQLGQRVAESSIDTEVEEEGSAGGDLGERTKRLCRQESYNRYGIDEIVG